MGWSDEAYDRYDAACKLISTQRGTVASKALEKEFKIRARDTYANGRVVSRTDTSREAQRIVFDELDVEQIISSIHIICELLQQNTAQNDAFPYK